MTAARSLRWVYIVNEQRKITLHSSSCQGCELSPAVEDWKPSATGLSGNGPRVRSSEDAVALPFSLFPESRREFPQGEPPKAAGGLEAPHGEAAASGGVDGYSNTRPVTPPPGPHQQGGSNATWREHPPEQGGSNATKITLGLDWLTLSIPRDDKPGQRLAAAAQVLHGTGAPCPPHCGYEGWQCCGGEGRVMRRVNSNGRTADLLILLPGRALEWIRSTNAFSDTDSQCTDADIARFFHDHGWTATRLDTAMDTTDESLNPHLVFEHLCSDLFTCPARKFRRWEERERGVPHNGGEGETVYVGGGASTRFMRVYDKQAEVMAKLGIDIGHLTRFELENKRDAAEAVLKLVAERGPSCIPAIFSGWIDFKDPADNATRMWRRRNVDWWERLVGGHEPIVLGLRRGIATPESSLNWVKTTAAKTLRLADEHGFTTPIQEAVQERRHRIHESDRAKWRAFQQRYEVQDGSNFQI